MKVGAAFAVLVLSSFLAVAAEPAAANDSSTSSAETSARARQASVLRAEAATLRDQANHLRDGEGVKTPNVPGALELERRAAELEQQADEIDPQDRSPQP